MNSQTQLSSEQILIRAHASLGELGEFLRPLAEAFAARGHRLYLVGGSVRDALLEKLGHDLDFTTDAVPDVVKQILEEFAEVVWDTGIDYGTVSAEKHGQLIEITTFRAIAHRRYPRGRW